MKRTVKNNSLLLKGKLCVCLVCILPSSSFMYVYLPSTVVRCCFAQRQNVLFWYFNVFHLLFLWVCGANYHTHNLNTIGSPNVASLLAMTLLHLRQVLPTLLPQFSLLYATLTVMILLLVFLKMTQKLCPFSCLLTITTCCLMFHYRHVMHVQLFVGRELNASHLESGSYPSSET